MRALKRDGKQINIDKIKYNFYVFDVETTCLEPMPKNFVFGVIYGFNYTKVLYSTIEFIEEFNNPKYKNKYLFAHNAEFDLLSIFGNVYTKIDSAAIFNGKFIAAKYNEFMFADSMNIYPTSVEKLGNLIGLPKLDNTKVKNNTLNSTNISKDDIKYCKRDCEIVYKCLLKIFEITGTIKLTMPSLSMYDFRHNYLKKDLVFSDLVDEFHESYYGGRTEAFKIGKVKAKVYDVNSMYPYVMQNISLPDVKRLKKITKCDVSYLLFLLDHYEGMTKITLIHAETYFGYIPYRAEVNKATKLVFPIGEFTTTVNFNELRFAIKSKVIEITKVHYIIYSTPVKDLFTEYIKDNYKKRQEATNDIDKMIHKLKMNSLYGKFGMKLKMTTTYYEIIPFNLIAQLKEEAKYCDIKLFNSIRQDCFIVTENEQLKRSFFSIATISSYITSEARVMLLKALVENEKNNVCYCDTDSVFLEGEFIGDVSSELGAFKLEEKKITAIRGLKNYTCVDEKGKAKDVIKGISKSAVKKKSTLKGNEYEIKQYYKTRASLRQNKEAGLSYTILKVVSGNYDKREILENGDTKPLVVKNDIFINAPNYDKK